VDVTWLVQVVVVMPPVESPQWRRKATDFFSTSGKFVLSLVTSFCFGVNHACNDFCADIPTFCNHFINSFVIMLML
jgi:hypothetical protein